MDFTTICYRTEGPLACLKLNRPAKLNAINGRMVAEIGAAMDAAEQDESVRVILLHGEGRAFSAGFDLEPQGSEAQTAAEERAALERELRDDFDMIMRFWDSRKPTLAAVHGYCLGGALELAMACDLTVSADNCRFGFPEARFGSGAVALLLPVLCGPKRARELLLTGNDRVPAEQAAAWGLVNRVVTAEELLPTAQELARDIARNDPVAVRLTKRAIRDSYEFPRLREALEHALQLDIEIESSETEESREFNRILKTEGARAAIAWRDRRLG